MHVYLSTATLPVHCLQEGITRVSLCTTLTMHIKLYIIRRNKAGPWNSRSRFRYIIKNELILQIFRQHLKLQQTLFCNYDTLKCVFFASDHYYLYSVQKVKGKGYVWHKALWTLVTCKFFPIITVLADHWNNRAFWNWVSHTLSLCPYHSKNREFWISKDLCLRMGTLIF